MHSITIRIGRLTLAAEPACAQLSWCYLDSTRDVKRVTAHTTPFPSLCNNGRSLGTSLLCFHLSSGRNNIILNIVCLCKFKKHIIKSSNSSNFKTFHRHLHDRNLSRDICRLIHLAAFIACAAYIQLHNIPQSYYMYTSSLYMYFQYLISWSVDDN